MLPVDSSSDRRGPSIRAAAYVRVSTARQAAEGLSRGAQRERIASRCAYEGWELVQVYEDAGLSGRTDDRPALQAMLRDAERGAFERVVVVGLDRLGRSNSDLSRNFDRLDDAGAQLVSLREGIDASTAAGRLLRTVLAGLAEFESDTISERVRSVTEARVEGGKPHGRPPLGYEDRDGQRVVAPGEAVIVRRIFEEFDAGTPQLRIAQALVAEGVPTKRGGEWEQGHVSRVLRNPHYVGLNRINGRSLPGTHEAIVGRELFDRAQRRLSTGPKGGRRPNGSHLLLGGLLRCGYCGEAMTPRTQRRDRVKTYEVYICHGQRKRGGDSCPQPPVPRELVDGPLLRNFTALGLDVDAMREQVAEAQARRVADTEALLVDAEKAARLAQGRLDRVRRDYQDGRLEADDWAEQRADLMGERDGADAKAEQLRARLAELEDLAPLRDVEADTLRALARLREAATAAVRDAETVDAVRAALGDLYESVRVWRTDRLSEDFMRDISRPEASVPEEATATEPLWTEAEGGVVLIARTPQPMWVEEFDAAVRPVLRRVAGADNNAALGLHT